MYITGMENNKALPKGTKVIIESSGLPTWANGQVAELTISYMLPNAHGLHIRMYSAWINGRRLDIAAHSIKEVL